MTGSNPELERLTDALLRYAAASGAFDPVDVLREVAGEDAFDDKVLMVEALSALRQDCTIEAGEDGDVWLIRPSVRRKVLAKMDPEALAATPAEKVGHPFTVKAAVAGDGRFAPEEIDRLVAEDADPDMLTHLAITLDRAGPKAPGFNKLVAVRSALNRARQARQTDETLAAGFFGRRDEIARLLDWIGQPQDSLPLQTAHVSGLPGIGKSFLLERIIQQVRRDANPILVRLDFDRSSLQVLNPYALFEEISRQIGDNLPEAAAGLRGFRLKSAEEAAALADSSQRPGFPRELLGAIGEAVERSGRAMLIVLDTLEVLRSTGATHVSTLFEHLDLLAEYGVGRISIVSAGRGDALGPVTDRIALSVPLQGLEDREAKKFLEGRNVDPSLWPRILPLARGNPLLLTLAAKAMEEESFDENEVPKDISDEAVAGYLYRAILSRVPDALGSVANEGLILRRINTETLMGILVPALGLNIESEAQAKDMLDDLGQHHWLVEHDEDWLRHRPDIRSAILDLIYRDKPRETAEIDRRAAEWFAETDPLTALYHRLQMIRRGAEVPRVPTDLASAFTERMIGDLPEQARDAVLQARGQRSGFGWLDQAEEALPEKASFTAIAGRRVSSRDAGAARRRHAPPQHLRYDPALQRIVFIELRAGEDYPPPDKRAVRDLELMLQKDDLREASHVLANGFDMPFAADSRAASTVLVHQWQTGQWSIAERILRLLSGRMLDQCLDEKPYLLGRMMLEIWAEFRFEELVARLDRPDMFERAALLLRDSAYLGLAGGALEFALICAAPADAPAAFFPNGLAALAPGMPGMPVETVFETLQRAQSWRQSLDLSFPGLDSIDLERDAARVAEAMMPINPYAGPIQANIHEAVDRTGGIALNYLDSLRPALAEAADRFAPGLAGVDGLQERLTSHPADVAQALSAMGLTAEWSSGFTFYRAVPDLPAIAKAAERWRRTVNGLWSYGRRRPRHWRGAGNTDWASAALAERLMAAPNPEREARRTLRFWADPTGTDPDFGRRQARRRLLQRYRDAIAAADGTPERALAVLQKADVPGCLAAPLAVLAAMGEHPDAVLSENDRI